jgi:flavin-dependent dehydrogenase
MKQVVIGGGGLSGLTCAFLLRKAGFEVTLIERKSYPFHRVCGEYISNEVIPFLKHQGLFPQAPEIADLKTFRLSSVSGRVIEMPLDLGGFGVSRYYLDHFLYQKCLEAGVRVLQKTQIKSVEWQGKTYRISLSEGQELQSPLYVAAHGKNSLLDKNRAFWTTSAEYVGVKYHLHLDFEPDVIALHNFEGGYCGLSKVEGNTFNLCYLTTKSQVKKYGSLENMEAGLLHQNPHLKEVWQKAQFVFDSPLVINNFNFEAKKPVENGIMMIGDAAGLITPLCGNGMALAFRAAELAARMIVQHHRDLNLLHKHYSQEWNRQFAWRLWIGRNLQALFGRKWHSELAVSIPKPIAKVLMSLTHGKADIALY